MAQEAYELVNNELTSENDVNNCQLLVGNAWKKTSKILFKNEIGELKEFSEYLKPAAIGQFFTSSFSDNKVWLASEEYNKKAKFFDYDEELSRFNQKTSSKPLDIDKIKDIDSILEAVKERLMYAGGKVLGNSKFVEDSDAIIDSTGVINSSILIKSKYIAYSYLLQNSEYTFGATSSGQCAYIIRCFYNNSLTRCFECSTSVKSSDCYFSYNLIGCSDCLFSFNLRAKRNMIGNIQMPKDRYNEIKSKLISEIADELKEKKMCKVSILDLIGVGS